MTTTQIITANEDLTITTAGSVVVTDPTNAIGVQFDPNYTGTFINRGSVSATMTAGNGTGSARAIWFAGDILGGDIESFGPITASSTGALAAAGDAPAAAHGIYVDTNVTGSSNFVTNGTITVTALGGSATAGASVFRDASATAQGIYMENIENLSSFTNTGNITVSGTGGTVTVGDDSTADASTDNNYGIHTNYIRNNASFNNSGAISLTAQGGTALVGANGTANADVNDTFGILVDDYIDNNSSFTNTGNITLSALGGTATVGDATPDFSSAYSYADLDNTSGIQTSDIDSGSSFENTGDIAIMAQGGTATAGNAVGNNSNVWAYADVDNTYGIEVDDIGNGSSFENTGAISIAASGGTATAGDAMGNDSNIRAYADILDTAGIQADEAAEGSPFTNTGNITVEAEGGTATAGDAVGDSSFAGTYADVDDTFGIEFTYEIDEESSFTNSGNITVAAQGGTATAGDALGSFSSTSADVGVNDTFGIFIDGDIAAQSSFTNTGNITVTAQGGTATAGTATVALGDYFANADVDDTFGIEIDEDIEEGSSFDNRGTISVTALGGTATAGIGSYVEASANVEDTYGIFIDSDVEEGSSFTNTGNITIAAQGGTATAGMTTATTGDYYAYADVEDTFGIEIDNDIDDGSTFENSGTISVTALGGTATVGNGDTAEAYADIGDTYGLFVDSDVENGSSFTNTSNITVAAQGGTATAGTATATSGTYEAYADIDDTFGIEIDNDIDASIFENRGTIAVTALGGTATAGNGNFAYTYADVDDTYGLFIDSDVEYGSTFTNTGNITVAAQGGTATAGTATVTTGDYYAYADVDDAFGLAIDNDIDGSTFENSGTISVTAQGGTATAGNGNLAYAYADVEDTAGLFIDSSVESGSSMSNTATISVNAIGGTASILAASGEAYAEIDDTYGLMIDSSLDDGSTFENSGAISVTAQGGTADAPNGDAAYAYADETYGMNFGAYIRGGSTAVNSAGITVSSTAGTANAGVSGTADAYSDDTAGIRVNIDIRDGASLNNSGTLTIRAKGGDATAGDNGDANAYVQNAYGITAEDNIVLGSVLMNSGNISLAAEAGDAVVGDNGFADASASDVSGIKIGESSFANIAGSSVTNSGNIGVSALGGTATAGVSGFADAFVNVSGIHVSGSVDPDATFSNSGRVTVIGQGGTATNASGDNGVADANAYGLRFGSDIDGHATNSGVIAVLAQAGTGDSSASAEAMGIFAEGTVSGSSLINTQNITAEATANGALDTAEAVGIDVASLDGLLSNSARVVALASNPLGAANAYGVRLGDITVNGSFINTGTLIGSAEGASGEGAGLYVTGNMDGDVQLSGTLIGSGTDNSYAVFFGGGTGTLGVSAPTFFAGDLVIADQAVTLTSGRSHSTHWNFTSGAGATFNLVENDGVPWFSRDGNPTLGEFATYDPTGQAMQDQMVSDVASFGDVSMRRNLVAAMPSNHSHARQRTLVGTTPSTEYTTRSSQSVWMDLQGFTFDYDGDQAAVQDFDTSGFGGAFGYANDSGHGFTYGLMTGFVSSDASATAQDLSGDSLFIGAGMATERSGFVIDGGLKFGWTDMDSTRRINNNAAPNGWDQANASFDATWGKVSLGTSYDIVLSPETVITPMAQVSYTRASISGYTETGAAANATVPDRDIDVFEGELGVGIRQKVGIGTLSGSLSYILRDTNGDDAIGVSMIGDSQSVGIDSAQYGAAKLGLGYSANINENTSFNIHGNIQAGSSSTGAQIMTGLNYRF